MDKFRSCELTPIFYGSEGESLEIVQRRNQKQSCDPNEPFIGEHNMIMGSDYGHQDQSKEDGMVGVMRRKKSIAPAVIEKILCDNPRRFYGL